jgi:hypothetical protein
MIFLTVLFLFLFLLLLLLLLLLLIFFERLRVAEIVFLLSATKFGVSNKKVKKFFSQSERS